MSTDAPTWKQAFAQYATPVLPDVDLVFAIRVDPDYYHSVLHHAVVKSCGDFSVESVQAFLKAALVDFYEAHKGKPQAADPEALARAEGLVPSSGKAQGGKVLRVDVSDAVKRDVATRLLLKRYGGNLDTAKRGFAKEALLAKLQAVLA